MAEDAHYRIEPPSGGYKVEKREIVAQVSNLRMLILTLAPGQEVPWHFHSEVTDTFFCMDGPMVIHTKEPAEQTQLIAGQSHAIPAGKAHRVTGLEGGRCKFAILQGIGKYDFRPIH